MEEDIKIVEEFINFLNKNGDYVVDENLRDEKMALEHLVQAYKQQADIIKNSVSKDKIIEIKKRCESQNMPCEIYNKESRNYWQNIGRSGLCEELLEGDE